MEASIVPGKCVRLAVLVALILATAAGLAPASARAEAGTGSPIVTPSGPQLAGTADTEPPTDQIIVKLKAATTPGSLGARPQAAQLSTLSAAAGTTLAYQRQMANGAQVLRLPASRPAAEVEQIAAQLAALPDVEYAQPDGVRYALLAPNDEYYSLQWHYYESTGGADLPAAWDITTGSSNVTVAVIDTGYRPHADLASHIVGGYDFVTVPFMANDGDGRDADARDPGDWVTVSDIINHSGICTTVSPSSWHGTHVAGTIGALSNNSTGVAGVNWAASILPVRVLGKCGGYDSDIIDGMYWAAGYSVPDVPANTHPAQVLNLSLGGTSSTCPSAYQTAVNTLTAAGKVIVVAAGNSSANVANDLPANCSGVIAVAATNRQGNRASYSNYGAGVTISAPGGDLVNGSVAGSGVASTWNNGTTTPGADAYAWLIGTSMAAPHVSGIVSLMLSVYPSFTSAQVTQLLRSTARSFPSGSSCSTSICGAGIVDAGAAVAAAMPPSISTVSPGHATVGDPAFTLTVTGRYFQNGAKLYWNGSARSTVFVSSTELQAAILAGDVASLGTATLKVVNPAPGSGESGTAIYGVLPPLTHDLFLPMIAK